MVVDLSMSLVGILSMTVLLMAFILIAKYLLLDPIDKVVTARDKSIETSQSNLHGLNKELHTLKTQFETNSQESVQEVNHIFESYRLDAVKGANTIVEESRNALRKKSAELHKDLEANRDTLKKELAPQVDEISQQIIKKVLG